MRVALGCDVFFSPFVLNFSSKTKHLSDMTKASFNWNESTWKHDYRQEFEDFKEALKAPVLYSILTITFNIVSGLMPANLQFLASFTRVCDQYCESVWGF